MLDLLTKIQCWLFGHQWSKWVIHLRGNNSESIKMYRFCLREGCSKVEIKGV